MATEAAAAAIGNLRTQALVELNEINAMYAASFGVLVQGPNGQLLQYQVIGVLQSVQQWALDVMMDQRLPALGHWYQKTAQLMGEIWMACRSRGRTRRGLQAACSNTSWARRRRQ